MAGSNIIDRATLRNADLLRRSLFRRDPGGRSPPGLITSSRSGHDECDRRTETTGDARGRRRGICPARGDRRAGIAEQARYVHGETGVAEPATERESYGLMSGISDITTTAGTVPAMKIRLLSRAASLHGIRRLSAISLEEILPVHLIHPLVAFSISLPAGRVDRGRQLSGYELVKIVSVCVVSGENLAAERPPC
jgi:hypothetical protein